MLLTTYIVFMVLAVVLLLIGIFSELRVVSFMSLVLSLGFVLLLLNPTMNGVEVKTGEVQQINSTTNTTTITYVYTPLKSSMSHYSLIMLFVMAMADILFMFF